MNAVDKSVKESMTMSRSTADLLPKLNATHDLSSVRSSRDREINRDDNSGELVEYEHQGNFKT